MAEVSKPNWIPRDDVMVAGDEDLTADGDTAEGGSSGDPSDEEGDGKANESDEESEGEDETKGKRSGGDDSSSVKSIQIFPRKNPFPRGDSGGIPGGGYDDISIMTSSVN